MHSLFKASWKVDLSFTIKVCVPSNSKNIFQAFHDGRPHNKQTVRQLEYTLVFMFLFTITHIIKAPKSSSEIVAILGTSPFTWKMMWSMTCELIGTIRTMACVVWRTANAARMRPRRAPTRSTVILKKLPLVESSLWSMVLTFPVLALGARRGSIRTVTWAMVIWTWFWYDIPPSSTTSDY